MNQYYCEKCDKHLTGDQIYTDLESPHWTVTRCKTCSRKTPRIINLSEPMPVMQSVVVDDDMINNGDIPY